MKSWLPHHHYALGVTFRRLWAQKFSSLANIVVITLALALPLLGGVVLQSMQPVARSLAADPQISIFMSTEAPEADTQAVAQRIQRDHGQDIIGIKVVTKAQALNELKANPAYGQALAVLPGNPLPDTIVVTLKGDDLVRKSAYFVKTWQNFNGVELVQVDSEWVQRLEAILRFLKTTLVFISLVVVVAVLSAVFNTVRMQALSQREEITVARLVGATESFVRRPFLYLGAVTCGISALAALGVVTWLTGLLNRELAVLASSYGAEFALRLPSWPWIFVFIVGAAGLGALAARWSVTRNTRY
ncbi:MAG: permease-like cell division protein FtsX [Pigmentiphaga sp.]